MYVNGSNPKLEKYSHFIIVISSAAGTDGILRLTRSGTDGVLGLTAFWD